MTDSRKIAIYLRLSIEDDALDGKASTEQRESKKRFSALLLSNQIGKDIIMVRNLKIKIIRHALFLKIHKST